LRLCLPRICCSQAHQTYGVVSTSGTASGPRVPCGLDLVWACLASANPVAPRFSASPQSPSSHSRSHLPSNRKHISVYQRNPYSDRRRRRIGSAINAIRSHHGKTNSRQP
jgi:hypothetical protein